MPQGRLTGADSSSAAVAARPRVGLRRTSIGPFEVGEADEQAMLALDDALARVDAFVAARAAREKPAA